MTYQEWEREVSQFIREDSLWRVEAYRLALFLSDLAWTDVSRLVEDRRTVAIADQLYRAVGKISSNIGEGYSRGTGKDRARFYEYALGSAREARDWYYKGRCVLSDKVPDHRMDLASQIIRLTLTMVSRERRSNRRVSVTMED
jgi:four helix bundle protein